VLSPLTMRGRGFRGEGSTKQAFTVPERVLCHAGAMSSLLLVRVNGTVFQKDGDMSLLRILFQVLILLIRLYDVVLLLRVMLTWLRISPYSNPFAKLLYDLTEPVLEPIRAIIPPVAMLDLSPLIVMLLLFALERALGILATGL